MAFYTTSPSRPSSDRESVQSMTEDEWDEQYQWLPDEYGDCCLLDEVPDNTPDEFVWTLVEGDCGGEVIVSGIRYVNRVGYIVTRHPHTHYVEAKLPRVDDRPEWDGSQ